MRIFRLLRQTQILCSIELGISVFLEIRPGEFYPPQNQISIQLALSVKFSAMLQTFLQRNRLPFLKDIETARGVSINLLRHCRFAA